MKAIPFIYRISEGDFEGVDINLAYKKVKGNSTGVDIVTYKEVDGNSKGLDATIIKKIKGNSTGVDITVGAKAVKGDSKGFDITGLSKYIERDFSGFDITGIYKRVEGCSKGISISGMNNYSGGVEDFLIQCAISVNVVDEVSDDAFVMQIGMSNYTGGELHPLFNFKGIKNIPRLIKKAFSKKSLEDKI